MEPQAFVETLNVNVVAPLRLIQLVLPGMRARREGLIVNVTSDAGVQAYPTWGGYGASKAALEHLSRVLAAEVEGTGIRVYVVDPGDMDTAMHRAAEPGVDLSHLPKPEDVAPAFVTLLDETRRVWPIRSAAPDRSADVTTRDMPALDFVLPPQLEAHEPPEARGLARDARTAAGQP